MADVLSQIVKLNGQTSGRDKLCRVVQYGSKFVWAHLQTRGYSKDTIKLLKDLEYQISTTRKLLRFGRSADFIHAALRFIHLKDPVLRFTLVAGRINQAFYLLFDHVIYLYRVGFVKVDAKNIQRTSAKFWLVSLVLNLVRDVHEVLAVARAVKAARAARAQTSDEPPAPEHPPYAFMAGMHELAPPSPFLQLLGATVRELLASHRPVVTDLVKNGCDIFLPLSVLGHTSISTQTQGLLGAVSSCAGLLAVWDPAYKLSPS